MSWAKGHSSLTKNSTAPTIDRCINYEDHEEVQRSTIGLLKGFSVKDE